MAIVNKIIHRFVRPREDYMDPTKELYNQIIPYNVQAYSYELRENGDPNIPDDYIVKYVLGTGRSTYQQIADGLGKDSDGNAIPELSKEFVINSSTQLVKIITDLIQSQVIVSSYITSNSEGDPFATKADLDSAEAWYSNGESVLPKINDYVIVIADETHPTGTGDPQTVKYVCVGILNDRPVWNYQYIINNGNFTPEQQAAIDSGITAEKVAKYDSYEDSIATALDHITDKNNPHEVTAEQIGLGNVNNTSDLDKPISIATQEALNAISTTTTEHIENNNIHVTPEDKETWNNKQDTLHMGNHIIISNNIIGVEDDLAGYNNSVSQFVNKHTNDLENYYNKEELGGVFKYQGEVEHVSDLPSGNLYAPDTYTEVQYLTADQLEYIDTHYYPNQNTRIELKFSINGEGNNYLYGTDIDHESNKVAFGINYGATIAKGLFGTKSVSCEIDSQVHNLVQKKTGLYIDDVQVGRYTNVADFITQSTLWLFRAQTSDTHPQNITIYEFKIYEEDELIGHYIPVTRNEDDIPGMYEVVSGDFYTNEYNPEEFDFIPGQVAGYGNIEGTVYKVQDDGSYYMWYDHHWEKFTQELGPDGITLVTENEQLTVIGMRTKSGDIMYDWIGTLEEWEEGRANGTIPDDWICWVKNDEEQPAGIANLAQVASSGDYNDLINKPTTVLPPLPADKDTKDYLLKWDHVAQSLVWESIS